MALMPYTASAAEAAGFVPLAGRQNLLTHARYPGFLFRTVANVEQAITCGGILIRGTEAQVMHFGLDLISVAKSAALGSWSYPTVISKEVNDKTVPVVYDWQGRYKTEHAVCDYVASGFQRTTPINDGSYIGVISRADRGLIVDLGFKAGIASVDHLVDVKTRYPFAAPEGNWVASQLYDKFCRIRLRLATVSGYISQHVEFDAGRFLAAAQSGFLDAIDAPGSVKSSYGDAYAKMRAAVEGEKTYDSFDVYPYVSATSQTVLFGVKRRRLTAYTHDQSTGFTRDDPPSFFRKACNPFFNNVQRTVSLEPGTTDPLSNALKEQDALAQRSSWVMPHEQHVHGHHFPLYVPVLIERDGLSSHSISAGALERGTYRAVAPGRVFPLDSVPVTHIEMLPNQKLPASALFAKISPRVGPLSGITGADEESIADRIELDIAEATGKLRAPVVPRGDLNGDGVSTTTEMEIECTQALESMRASEAVLRRQTMYLPPMSKFVFDVICGVDAGARGDDVSGLGAVGVSSASSTKLNVPSPLSGKPFSLGSVYTSVDATTAGDSRAVLVGYTLITDTSGSFTIPETGRYCIVLQAAGSAWGVPTGNSTFNAQYSGAAPGSVPGETEFVELDLKLGDTVRFAVERGSQPITIASQSYSTLSLEISGSRVHKSGVIGYTQGALGRPNRYLVSGAKAGPVGYGAAATATEKAGPHLLAIAKVGP